MVNYSILFLSIFKSIDPWILGLCRSYCYKHGWKYNTSTSRLSKRSIFSSGYNLNGVNLKRSKSSSTRNLNVKKKLKRRKKKSKKPMINLNYSENPSQLSQQSINLDSSLAENVRNKNNLTMIKMLDERNDFSSSESSCDESNENPSEVEDEDAEAEEYTKPESDNYYTNSEFNCKKLAERSVKSACNLTETKKEVLFSSHPNINDKNDKNYLNIDRLKKLNLK